MSMTYTEVLSRFDNPIKTVSKKGVKQSYKVTCPCHTDKQQSLVISESAEGKILFYDHAGCSTENILAAVNLEWSDVFGNDDNNRAWKSRLEWYYGTQYEWKDSTGKKHKGYGEGVRVTDEYPYYNEAGEYQYSKVRFEGGAIDGKLIRYYTIRDDKAEPCKLDEVEKQLYNLRDFLKLKDKAKNVYVVEGEKDVETLRKLKNGFGCCVTPGGASDWQKEYARLFKGLNVTILRDNDEAGAKFAEKIQKDLRPFAYSVKIVNPSRLPKGDVTDYLTKEGGTAETLKELCEKVSEVQFASWVKTDKDGRACGINTGILAETISENEQYIIVRNMIDDKDQFLRYEKGTYHLLNKGAVKAMIREYVPSAHCTDSALNNVHNLLFATSEKVHAKSELNGCYKYINLKNGLYDISTGDLIPHTPEVLSTIQFGFNYDSDAKCDVFLKFVNDLCSKPDGSIDKEQIMQIQEYFGFLLSNEAMRKIKKAMFLWSRQGNSGKSVLIRLLISFFGLDHVASIKLGDMKPDNNFILGTLPDCRVICCGDESNTSIQDSSIFKSLTGGDAVKVESKGRQGFSFEFRGGIVIACNGLPHFQDDRGNHLYDRILIIPCVHTVTEKEKDPELDEKLARELPGIFNWSLKGLERLTKNHFNFTLSKSSQVSKEEYRKETDSLYRFVTHLYDLTGNYSDTVSKTELEDFYYEWCAKQVKQEGVKIFQVERKNIKVRLESYGITNDLGNVGELHHISVYRGLKLKGLHPIEE